MTDLNQPTTDADFDYIYNPDGTCHQWDCGAMGVVLAYDSFSPEGALWFCSAHWEQLEAIAVNWFTVVEDRREKPQSMSHDD